MGFSDALGGGFGSLGAMLGDQLTQFQKAEILRNLKANLGDAQGLDTAGLGNTAFSGLSTDPETRAAQMQALHQLQGLSQANGLDPQAQAMQAEANRESSGYEMAQRQAQQQNMAARGMGGSGAEIAGLNAAQQGGANRSAEGGQKAASDARTRALQALAGSASLATQVRGQDYSQAADKANALDRARLAKFGGDVTKYGAVSGARGGLNNYYAADRAEQIGNYAAAGKGIGGMVGGGMDFGAGLATAGMGKMGGAGQGAVEGAGTGYSQKTGIPWSVQSPDLTDEERQKQGMGVLNSLAGWGG